MCCAPRPCVHLYLQPVPGSVRCSCFKRSTIIPVPKKTSPACHNGLHPIALTSMVMKRFVRLIKDFICASLPTSFNLLQFAHRPNRSTDDAINHVLHSTLTHLDCSCVQSFLTDRPQVVRIGNCTSSTSAPHEAAS